YIVEPISEKSLTFKVGLQIKALKAQRRGLRQADLRERDAKTKGASKDKKSVPGQDDQPSVEGVEEKEAIDNPGDVWVFKGKQPKKKGGKWSMRMKGPDPSEGEWVPVEDKEGSGNKWRFQEKDADPKKKSGWEWTGDKPEFANGEWGFQGGKPSLNLVNEKGETEAAKVESDGAGGIVVTKDSETALRKEEERELAQAMTRAEKKKGIFSGKDGEDKKGGSAQAGEGQEEKAKESPASNLNQELMEEALKAALAQHHEKKGDKNSAALTETNQEMESSGSGKAGDANAKTKKNGAASAGDKLGLGVGEEESEEKTGAKKLEEKMTRTAKPGSEAHGETLGLNEAGSEKQGRQQRSTDEKKKKTKEGEKSAPADKDLDELDPKDPLTAFAKSVIEEQKKSKAKEPEDQKKKGSKRAPGDLAEMAMSLEEEASGYDGGFSGEGEQDQNESSAKAGQNEAKKWKGHDLSPDELQNKKTRDKNANKKPRKKGSADATSEEKEKDGEDPGESEAEELGAGERNFLKKKKKKGKEDASAEMDEESAGWSTHRPDSDKKSQWQGRDSEQEDGAIDDGDKTVEVDASGASIKAKKGSIEIFEYPAEHFGTLNGAWENAGAEPKDPAKTKLHVYLELSIREKTPEQLKEIQNWWVFRGERPTYSAQKKLWFCKQNRPRSYAGFDALPQVVRDYILSILGKPAPRPQTEEAQQDGDEAAESVGEASGAEAKEKKKPTSLPSAPMMAILVSEMIYEAEGDASKVIELFCGYVIGAMTDVNATAVLVDESELTVVAGLGGAYQKGQTVSARAEFDAVLKSKQYEVHLEDKRVVCPVIAKAKSGDSKALGMIAFEAKSSPEQLVSKAKYLSGIAQCLKGSFLQLQVKAQLTKKSAA
ncbi:MAG: hypothetical protein AB1540_14690, partial [Bdellovibrionota bacterium]